MQNEPTVSDEQLVFYVTHAILLALLVVVQFFNCLVALGRYEARAARYAV
jgi:hypothetical protein